MSPGVVRRFRGFRFFTSPTSDHHQLFRQLIPDDTAGAKATKPNLEAPRGFGGPVLAALAVDVAEERWVKDPNCSGYCQDVP